MVMLQSNTIHIHNLFQTEILDGDQIYLLLILLIILFLQELVIFLNQILLRSL